MSLTATLFIWSIFTVWELQRINVIRGNGGLGGSAWLYVVLATVVFGPAATLAATWGWREVHWKSPGRFKRTFLQGVTRYRQDPGSILSGS
jgi:hypothetical protein